MPLKLDDPKTAALTFVRAIGAGDVSTAKAASLGTDRQKRWVVATASMVNGLRSFDVALARASAPPPLERTWTFSTPSMP